MLTRPSPRSERLGTPKTPAIRFTRDLVFEASLVRICYGLSGCSPPWTDRTKFPWSTGDFYIQASDGSVALPAAGYDYNSTGLLCWRDFHPQEWQLNHVYFENRSFSSSGSRRSLVQRRSATTKGSWFRRASKSATRRVRSSAQAWQW